SWLVIVAGADVLALMLIKSLRSAAPWRPRVRLREWMELPVTTPAVVAAQPMPVDHLAEVNRKLAGASALLGAAVFPGTLDRSHRRGGRTMPLNRSDQILWPRRPDGIRLRASAPRMLNKRHVIISRPAGWLLRLLALLVIAVPSLVVTSPGYVAFAEKLPQATDVTSAIPEDTLIYAADNKTLLADLHPPGYQAYFEPLSQMGQLLPQAVIAIEDRNFYNEPGIDPQGIVRAATVDLKSHRPVEGAS